MKHCAAGSPVADRGMTMGVFKADGSGFHRFAACLAVCLMAGALCALGCSKPPEKDPFFEHWSRKAEDSQGFSPSAGPKNLAGQAKPIESTHKTRVSETMLNAKPWSWMSARKRSCP
jgi:hypothetical protein